MIKFEKFGKTIEIRNDDWEKLKERFNLENAEWDSLGENYLITGDCPLCIRYDCETCPFSVFLPDKEELSCVEFLRELCKPMYFDPGHHRITWSRQANKLARKQLGQLLKMMDKIEASQ